jgi:regulator of protease activity HflC (stomatin/prohibitin superfamily)
MAPLIVALVLAAFAILLVASSIRIVRQARVGVVERWGKYRASLTPGLHVIIPMLDRITAVVDMRETVQAFAPQPVITQDNVTIGIDIVVYYQVTDPFRATYEVANVLVAMEQLAITTLRNVVGAMTLEETLTSRDMINTQLRTVLDEATEKWGVRVTRVELKSIDPPRTIQEAMEQQMRADRAKRAAVLQAEGEKQSAILRAQGQREAAILQAEGQAKAIDTVFRAIHEGDADPKLLAYQYLQVLPQIAQGESNKVWIIPSEVTKALGHLGSALPGGNREPES